MKRTRVDLHTPKMLIIQFHTTKIIIIQFHTPSVWRKCLPYNFHIWKLYDWHFLFFFFNRKPNFVRKQTFSEKNFLLNFFFLCVHNVVHDTIMLAFFHLIFFSKTLKIPISFVWCVDVCLDQCLII